MPVRGQSPTPRPGMSAGSPNVYGRFHLALAERLAARLYYGWVIVGVVIVSNLVAYSPNPTFGLFVTPLEQEFGWSRSIIAGAQATGPVAGALLAPLLGLLTDRLGIRTMMVSCALLAAGGYLILSRVSQAWQFYAAYGLIFAVMFSGCALLMGNAAVSRWFRRRRGRAMGFITMGASGGGVLFIAVQTALIAGVGWRGTYAVMALMPLLLILLPALLLMVDTPAALGQEGHPELTGGGADRHGTGAEHSFTVGEAVRTRAFWLTLPGVMLGNFVVWGYFGHAVPHMENLGFSRPLASSVWATFFVTGVVAKFGWGFLTEKLTVRWSVVFCLAAEAVGLYLLMNARSPADLFLYAVLNGLGHGPYLQLMAQVWVDYFGPRSIGSIYGTIQPFFVAAGALGPLVGGLLFDRHGDYHAFFTVLVVATLAGAVIFAVNRPPRKAPAPVTAPPPAAGPPG